MLELPVQIIRDADLMLKNVIIYHLVDQRYAIAIILAVLTSFYRF